MAKEGHILSDRPVAGGCALGFMLGGFWGALVGAIAGVGLGLLMMFLGLILGYKHEWFMNALLAPAFWLAESRMAVIR